MDTHSAPTARRRARKLALLACLVAAAGIAAGVVVRGAGRDPTLAPDVAGAGASAAARPDPSQDAARAAAPVPPDEAAHPPHRVQVLGADDAPVAGAEVAAFDADDALADILGKWTPSGTPSVRPPEPLDRGRSGADGLASIRGAPDGWSVVVVTAPGAARSVVAVPISEVCPDPLVVRLVAGVALRGHASAPGGGPASGVEVVVVPTVKTSRWPTANCASRTRTDASGAWSVADLVPGDHEVWTIDPTGAVRSHDAVRVPRAAPLDLQLFRGTELDGLVLDGFEGPPLAHAGVRLTFGIAGRNVIETKTDAGGRFRVETRCDRIDWCGAAVRPPNGPWIASDWEMSVHPLPYGDGFRRRVSLIAQKTSSFASLRGTVRGPDGPIAGAIVAVRRDGSPGVIETLTAADGTWRLSGLEDARGCRVTVTLDGAVRWRSTLGPSDGDDRELASDVGPRAFQVFQGTVIDGSGEPIASAVVEADDGSPHALSGPDGRFAIRTGAGEFEVALRAGARGCAWSRWETRSPDSPIEFEVWRLEETRGRVLAEDGMPAAGVRIAHQVDVRLRDRADEYCEECEHYGEAVTGPDGCYVLTGLRGRVVAVSPATGLGASVVFDDAAEAYPDLRLGADPFAAGRVVFEGTDTPAAGVEVWSFTHGDEPLPCRVATTDAAGRFLAPPTNPGVGLTKFEKSPEPPSLDVVVVGGPFANVQVPIPELRSRGEAPIELPRRIEVEGRVTDESGAPVPWAGVSDGSGDSFPADDDGRFRWCGRAPPDGNLFVVTGRPDLASCVVPGVSGSGRRDVVLPAGRTAEGVVVDADGVPVAHALLVVQVTGTSELLRERTLTDATGHFRLGGLPKAARALTVESPEHRDFDTTTGPDDGGPLRIVLQRGLEVTGTVVGSDGRPDTGRVLWVRPLGGGLARFARTDASGRFRVAGLGPGRVRVETENPDREGSVEADAGATGVVLRLPSPDEK